MSVFVLMSVSVPFVCVRRSVSYRLSCFVLCRGSPRSVVRGVWRSLSFSLSRCVRLRRIVVAVLIMAVTCAINRQIQLERGASQVIAGESRQLLTTMPATRRTDHHLHWDV